MDWFSDLPDDRDREVAFLGHGVLALTGDTGRAYRWERHNAVQWVSAADLADILVMQIRRRRCCGGGVESSDPMFAEVGRQ